MPLYVFSLTAVSEQVIEASNLEEAKAKLQEMDPSEHTWYDRSIEDYAEIEE